MALQNGIIKGDQAAKLYSYPTLTANTDTYLNGAGNFVAVTNATSAKGGFMSAEDKAFIDALKTGSLKNPTTNATTGALEYKYNNTVIISTPVASGS